MKTLINETHLPKPNTIIMCYPSRFDRTIKLNSAENPEKGDLIQFEKAKNSVCYKLGDLINKRPAALKPYTNYHFEIEE